MILRKNRLRFPWLLLSFLFSLGLSALLLSATDRTLGERNFVFFANGAASRDSANATVSLSAATTKYRYTFTSYSRTRKLPRTSSVTLSFVFKTLTPQTVTLTTTLSLGMTDTYHASRTPTTYTALLTASTSLEQTATITLETPSVPLTQSDTFSNTLMTTKTELLSMSETVLDTRTRTDTNTVVPSNTKTILDTPTATSTLSRPVTHTLSEAFSDSESASASLTQTVSVSASESISASSTSTATIGKCKRAICRMVMLNGGSFAPHKPSEEAATQLHKQPPVGGESSNSSSSSSFYINEEEEWQAMDESELNHYHYCHRVLPFSSWAVGGSTFSATSLRRVVLDLVFPCGVGNFVHGSVDAPAFKMEASFPYDFSATPWQDSVRPPSDTGSDDGGGEGGEPLTPTTVTPPTTSSPSSSQNASNNSITAPLVTTTTIKLLTTTAVSTAATATRIVSTTTAARTTVAPAVTSTVTPPPSPSPSALSLRRLLLSGMEEDTANATATNATATTPFASQVSFNESSVVDGEHSITTDSKNVTHATNATTMADNFTAASASSDELNTSTMIFTTAENESTSAIFPTTTSNAATSPPSAPPSATPTLTPIRTTATQQRLTTTTPRPAMTTVVSQPTTPTTILPPLSTTTTPPPSANPTTPSPTRSPDDARDDMERYKKESEGRNPFTQCGSIGASLLWIDAALKYGRRVVQVVPIGGIGRGSGPDSENPEVLFSNVSGTQLVNVSDNGYPLIKGVRYSTPLGNEGIPDADTERRLNSSTAGGGGNNSSSGGEKGFTPRLPPIRSTFRLFHLPNFATFPYLINISVHYTCPFNKKSHIFVLLIELRAPANTAPLLESFLPSPISGVLMRSGLEADRPVPWIPRARGRDSEQTSLPPLTTLDPSNASLEPNETHPSEEMEIAPDAAASADQSMRRRLLAMTTTDGMQPTNATTVPTTAVTTPSNAATTAVTTLKTSTVGPSTTSVVVTTILQTTPFDRTATTLVPPTDVTSTATDTTPEDSTSEETTDPPTVPPNTFPSDSGVATSFAPIDFALLPTYTLEDMVNIYLYNIALLEAATGLVTWVGSAMLALLPITYTQLGMLFASLRLSQQALSYPSRMSTAYAPNAVQTCEQYWEDGRQGARGAGGAMPTNYDTGYLVQWFWGAGAAWEADNYSTAKSSGGGFSVGEGDSSNGSNGEAHNGLPALPTYSRYAHLAPMTVGYYPKVAIFNLQSAFPWLLHPMRFPIGWASETEDLRLATVAVEDLLKASRRIRALVDSFEKVEVSEYLKSGNAASSSSAPPRASGVTTAAAINKHVAFFEEEVGRIVNDRFEFLFLRGTIVWHALLVPFLFAICVRFVLAPIMYWLVTLEAEVRDLYLLWQRKRIRAFQRHRHHRRQHHGRRSRSNGGEENKNGATNFERCEDTADLRANSRGGTSPASPSPFDRVIYEPTPDEQTFLQQPIPQYSDVIAQLRWPYIALVPLIATAYATSAAATRLLVTLNAARMLFGAQQSRSVEGQRDWWSMLKEALLSSSSSSSGSNGSGSHSDANVSTTPPSSSAIPESVRPFNAPPRPIMNPAFSDCVGLLSTPTLEGFRYALASLLLYGDVYKLPTVYHRQTPPSVSSTTATATLLPQNTTALFPTPFMPATSSLPTTTTATSAAGVGGDSLDVPSVASTAEEATRELVASALAMIPEGTVEVLYALISPSDAVLIDSKNKRSWATDRAMAMLGALVVLLTGIVLIACLVNRVPTIVQKFSNGTTDVRRFATAMLSLSAKKSESSGAPAAVGVDGAKIDLVFGCKLASDILPYSRREVWESLCRVVKAVEGKTDAGDKSGQMKHNNKETSETFERRDSLVTVKESSQSLRRPTRTLPKQPTSQPPRLVFHLEHCNLIALVAATTFSNTRLGLRADEAEGEDWVVVDKEGVEVKKQEEKGGDEVKKQGPDDEEGVERLEAVLPPRPSIHPLLKLATVPMYTRVPDLDCIVVEVLAKRKADLRVNLDRDAEEKVRCSKWKRVVALWRKKRRRDKYATGDTDSEEEAAELRRRWGDDGTAEGSADAAAADCRLADTHALQMTEQQLASFHRQVIARAWRAYNSIYATEALYQSHRWPWSLFVLYFTGVITGITESIPSDTMDGASIKCLVALACYLLLSVLSVSTVTIPLHLVFSTIVAIAGLGAAVCGLLYGFPELVGFNLVNGGEGIGGGLVLYEWPVLFFGMLSCVYVGALAGGATQGIAVIVFAYQLIIRFLRVKLMFRVLGGYDQTSDTSSRKQKQRQAQKKTIRERFGEVCAALSDRFAACLMSFKEWLKSLEKIEKKGAGNASGGGAGGLGLGPNFSVPMLEKDEAQGEPSGHQQGKKGTRRKSGNVAFATAFDGASMGGLYVDYDTLELVAQEDIQTKQRRKKHGDHFIPESLLAKKGVAFTALGADYSSAIHSPKKQSIFDEIKSRMTGSSAARVSNTPTAAQDTDDFNLELEPTTEGDNDEDLVELEDYSANMRLLRVADDREAQHFSLPVSPHGDLPVIDSQTMSALRRHQQMENRRNTKHKAGASGGRRRYDPNAIVSVADMDLDLLSEEEEGGGDGVAAHSVGDCDQLIGADDDEDFCEDVLLFGKEAATKRAIAFRDPLANKPKGPSRRHITHKMRLAAEKVHQRHAQNEARREQCERRRQKAEEREKARRRKMAAVNAARMRGIAVPDDLDNGSDESDLYSSSSSVVSLLSGSSSDISFLSYSSYTSSSYTSSSGVEKDGGAFAKEYRFLLKDKQSANEASSVLNRPFSKERSGGSLGGSDFWSNANPAASSAAATSSALRTTAAARHPSKYFKRCDRLPTVAEDPDFYIQLPQKSSASHESSEDEDDKGRDDGTTSNEDDDDSSVDALDLLLSDTLPSRAERRASRRAAKLKARERIRRKREREEAQKLAAKAAASREEESTFTPDATTMAVIDDRVLDDISHISLVHDAGDNAGFTISEGYYYDDGVPDVGEEEDVEALDIEIQPEVESEPSPPSPAPNNAVTKPKVAAVPAAPSPAASPKRPPRAAILADNPLPSSTDKPTTPPPLLPAPSLPNKVVDAQKEAHERRKQLARRIKAWKQAFLKEKGRKAKKSDLEPGSEMMAVYAEWKRLGGGGKKEDDDDDDDDGDGDEETKAGAEKSAEASASPPPPPPRQQHECLKGLPLSYGPKAPPNAVELRFKAVKSRLGQRKNLLVNKDPRLQSKTLRELSETNEEIRVLFEEVTRLQNLFVDGVGKEEEPAATTAKAPPRSPPKATGKGPARSMGKKLPPRPSAGAASE